MDHSSAHAMDLAIDSIQTTIITSKFTHEEREHSLSKGENLMHNKEQHQQSEYYKHIKDTIKNYDEVLLFGPTTAKNEMANLLKEDILLNKIKVDVKQAGKMTENQEHAFVKAHFSESHPGV